MRAFKLLIKLFLFSILASVAAVAHSGALVTCEPKGAGFKADGLAPERIAIQMNVHLVSEEPVSLETSFIPNVKEGRLTWEKSSAGFFSFGRTRFKGSGVDHVTRQPIEVIFDLSRQDYGYTGRFKELEYSCIRFIEYRFDLATYLETGSTVPIGETVSEDRKIHLKVVEIGSRASAENSETAANINSRGVDLSFELDEQVCKKATYGNQWSDDKYSAPYVSEAKRRGLECGLGADPARDSLFAGTLTQLSKLSDAELCEFATYKYDATYAWESRSNYQGYVEEAKRRGLSCGTTGGGQIRPTWQEVRRNQVIALSDSKLCDSATFDSGVGRQWKNSAYFEDHVAEAQKRSLDCSVGRSVASVAEPDLIDSAEVRALMERLAQLESKQKGEQQAISQDTQSPSIRITSSNSDGARGTISGTATDNTGIAEVLVEGQTVAVDSSGRFTTSTFIPSTGIDVQITAYDLKGLSTSETVRLERTKRTQQVSRLAAVNPLVGPKQKSSRDRAALIIGLEQYAAAPPADYASRDAQMFADYAREKLGIAPGNIKVLTDTEATRSGLLRALKVWLPQAVQPDKTDLYVFYAGHGMASDDGESAYIVPYGADTFLLEDTAISRERFYEEIGAAKPRTATFFFDNCYAGTTRSEERLLAQRPLSIKVQESPVPDNYLVFTAGESNQTAGVLDEVKHGRFSYFVFKGLEGEADANSDGKISAGELHAYVKESVGRFSAGNQTPTMLGDGSRWVLR